MTTGSAGRRRAAAVLLGMWIATAVAVQAQAGSAEMAEADGLFKGGHFAEAGKIYMGIATKDPKNYSAAVQLGQISLLENHLQDSQKWLTKALAAKPGDVNAKIMLAETYYRENKFAQAAETIEGVDSANPMLMPYLTLNAAKLASFRGQTAYELKGAGDITRVKFVKIEPLPVVNVKINGGREVTFFIDTGGSELLLDSEFAKELGVKEMGSAIGAFSGGQHASVGNGRVESLTLGDWTLRNVPVGMIPLRSLSVGFGVAQINGCVGTNVLYQFLSTLDYTGGELILRRKTAANLKRFRAETASKAVTVPMWLQGDHFMLGWGKINAMPPSLLFVDSGLAGAAVKLSQAVIQQAGIHMEEDKASTGAGGAGTFKIVPYTVANFTFGTIVEHNVAGLYDGPLDWSEGWGFHVDGMVGNDFLKAYAVTFDFENMEIYLVK